VLAAVSYAVYSCKHIAGESPKTIARQTEPEIEMEEATASSAGLEALAFRLTERLAADAAAGGGENVVFSPLSIYAALALAAAGARGRTLDELLAILGAPSRGGLAEFVRGLVERALVDRSPAGGPCVMFACGLWHDKTRELRPAYRAATAESYKAEMRAVDFRRKVGPLYSTYR
jgi:serpin B